MSMSRILLLHYGLSLKGFYCCCFFIFINLTKVLLPSTVLDLDFNIYFSLFIGPAMG